MSRFSRLCLLTVFFIFSLSPIMAQMPEQSAGQSSRGSAFFISPLAEFIGYGRNSPSAGGGFALGIDDGVALGLRCLYAFELNGEGISALEITALLRCYLRGLNAYTGPYVQLGLGSVLFSYQDTVSVPAKVGVFSVALAFGWRFPLGEYWFIEPAVRAGYPYMYGAGLAVALRL